MKRTSALYAVTAIAALSIASQAFAKGGSMGGGMGHSGTNGTPKMTSTMIPVGGNGMQQGTMQGNVTHHGPAVGSGPQNMTPGGSGTNAGQQYGQVHVNGTGMTSQQPPVTATTN